MYKVAWIARFPQGMAKEDARRHWAEIHGPMCIKTPGIERYVQNHVAGPLPLMSGSQEETSSTATRAAGGRRGRVPRVDGDAGMAGARR